MGNHAVTGWIPKEFLEFSALNGNDLCTIGLTDGCKWCVCTSRRKEALDAHRIGQIGKNAVPQVFLHATDESALEKVKLEDLKDFALEGDASNSSTKPQDPTSRPNGMIKEV